MFTLDGIIANFQHRTNLARSEPTRKASAGGQLRALNRLRAEALGDLAIGIDAGEIEGPVWSVSDRGTAGAFRSSRADSGAQVLPPAGATRSALASREKCPCFQFARLLRSRPSIVRGPVLLPP